MNIVKNMKTNALVASALLSTGVLIQTANANPIPLVGPIVLGTTYESALVSSTPIDVPGDNITVDWSVSAPVAGVYTYTYVVVDSPDPVDVVDHYSVAFATAAPGAFIAGSQTGGTGQQNNLVDLAWTFNAISTGFSSPALSFKSMDAPTLGNANATDANPPSPWDSTPGGQQVGVPNIPDGGITVCLLGGAMIGLGAIRRKL